MLPAGIVEGMDPGLNEAEDGVVIAKLEAKAASRARGGRDDSLPILGAITPSTVIGATDGFVVSWAGTSGGAGC